MLETRNCRNNMSSKTIVSITSTVSDKFSVCFLMLFFSRRMQLRRSRDRRVGSTDSEHDPGAILSRRRDRGWSEIPVRSQRPLLYTTGQRVQSILGLRERIADDHRAQCLRHARERRHHQGSAGVLLDAVFHPDHSGIKPSMEIDCYAVAR